MLAAYYTNRDASQIYILLCSASLLNKFYASHLDKAGVICSSLTTQHMSSDEDPNITSIVILITSTQSH